MSAYFFEEGDVPFKGPTAATKLYSCVDVAKLAPS